MELKSVSELWYYADQQDNEEALLILAAGGYEKVWREGISLLGIAAHLGNLAVIELLLESGESVETKHKGATPLYHACQQGHVEVVKLLLEAGANVKGRSPLHVATKWGHCDVVKVLLETGVSPNTTNIRGQTALITAAIKGYLEVMKLLLDRGAHVDYTDNDGFSPLYHASLVGFFQGVQLLVDRGATLDLESTYGFTPLTATDLDVVDYLLVKGATLNLHSCKSAMIRSILEGHVDLVARLIKQCSQILIEVPSAILLATESMHSKSTQILKVLIENGAPVESRTCPYSGGRKPALQAAVENRQVDKVWLLAFHGATTSKVQGSDSEIQEALRHVWTPQTHKLHPCWTKEALNCVLLISKKQRWPFDQFLLHKIISYIAYDWNTKRGAKPHIALSHPLPYHLPPPYNNHPHMPHFRLHGAPRGYFVGGSHFPFSYYQPH